MKICDKVLVLFKYIYRKDEENSSVYKVTRKCIEIYL